MSSYFLSAVVKVVHAGFYSDGMKKMGFIHSWIDCFLSCFFCAFFPPIMAQDMTCMP